MSQNPTENDDGADPTDEIRKQNPGETTAVDVGSRGEAHTPDKSQDRPHGSGAR